MGIANLPDGFEVLSRKNKLDYIEQCFFDAAKEKNISRMYDLLTLMSKYVTPDHARGAINPDFLNIHQSDLLCVACIIAGYKKVARWQDSVELTTKMFEVFTMFGLHFIEVPISKRYSEYIIYSSRGSRQAKKLVALIPLTETTEITRLVGECLGYPPKDIEYFLKGNIEYLDNDRRNKLKDIL